MRQLVPTGKSNISSYMADVGRYPLLTADEELELTRLYRDTGDVEAARRIVTANLRFVVKIAYEYVRYGVKLADLLQEGNLGLLTAVQNF